MGMLWVERQLRETGDPQDAEFADHIASVERARGRDVKLPPTDELLQDPDFVKAALRTDTIERYLKEHHTPELVTQTWNNFLLLNGLDHEISVCDRSEEEIQQLEGEGRMMVYIPEKLSGPEALRGLQRSFGFSVVDGTGDLFKGDKDLRVFTSIENIYDQKGWLDIDREKSVRDLEIWGMGERNRVAHFRSLFEKQGRQGQTINTYILGSGFSKFIDRERFDVSGSLDSCALLGSKLYGETVLVSQGYGNTLSLYSNLYCLRSARSVGYKDGISPQ